MRKGCLFLVLFVLYPAIASADKLTITSTPSGATVEIDGVKVGKTPFVKDYPGGYFRRTKTAFGSRLEHPLVARVTLEGFAPKVVTLCDGPQEWRDIHGRGRGEYWTFKNSSFEVPLVPIAKEFTGEFAVKTARNTSVEYARDLKLEEVVALVKPSVVYLMTIDKVKFRKPVVPGDQVRYHMTRIAKRRNMWWFRGEAKVEGALVCEGHVSAMLVDK